MPKTDKILTKNSCCIIPVFSVSLNNKLNIENLILTTHIVLPVIQVLFLLDLQKRVLQFTVTPITI